MPTSSANPWRVLIVQGGLGLAWMLCAPNRTNVPAFRPAIILGNSLHTGIYPMRLWGGLLLVIAACLTVAMGRRSRRGIVGWSAALAMYYSFWTVAFIGAVLTIPHSSVAAAFWALGFAWYAFERATPPRRRKGET